MKTSYTHSCMYEYYVGFKWGGVNIYKLLLPENFKTKINTELSISKSITMRIVNWNSVPVEVVFILVGTMFDQWICSILKYQKAIVWPLNFIACFFCWLDWGSSFLSFCHGPGSADVNTSNYSIEAEFKNFLS